MKLPTKKNMLWVILSVLVVIQFFQIDKTKPDLYEDQDFLTITQPPSDIAQMIKGACYDCHSTQVNWPWYASIQPVGWWVRGHTRGAQQHLNFSEWSTYTESKQAHKLEECAEEVIEKEMPLKSYGWMHPEGRLSDTDRTKLAAWFEQQ